MYLSTELIRKVRKVVEISQLNFLFTIFPMLDEADTELKKERLNTRVIIPGNNTPCVIYLFNNAILPIIVCRHLEAEFLNNYY